MMTKISIHHYFFFAIAFLLATSVSFISALVPSDCLSCRSPVKASSSFPWQPASRNAIHKSSHPFLVSLSATAVDDTLVETTSATTKNSKLPPAPLPPPHDEDALDLSSRVINFVFLACAFGYAAYTILNIDNGMTRGWTTGEIAMRIPLDNWGAYESYLANKPIFTKTLINVIIYLLGDWLSQTAFQGKNVLDFDISRTLRNGFIGLCFGPLVHEYYQFSDTILPPENGLVTRLEKIFMDQTLYLTIKCSIYISAVGLLGGDDLPTVKQTVQDKIGGVVLTAWKFWPLVHCITYGLIPARHRILWVNSVDLVWNAILASQAQKTDDVEDGGDGMAAGDDASSLVLEAVATEVLEEDEDEDDIAQSLHASTEIEVPTLILENHSSLLKSSTSSSSEPVTTTTTIDVMEVEGNIKPMGTTNSTEALLVSN